jgi:hypothetical protein
VQEAWLRVAGADASGVENFRGWLTAIVAHLLGHAPRAEVAAVPASLARASAGAPTLSPEIHGAAAVAAIFKGRAQAARPALIDGEPGLIFARGGKPVVVFDFVVENGRIVEISADASSIAALHLTT